MRNRWILVGGLGLAACANNQPDSTSAPLPIGEFEGVLNAETGTFRVTAVGGGAQGLQVLNTAQNGVPNNGAANTVELVTLSTGQCAGPNTFGGLVELNSFYGGATNLVVQLTSLTPATTVQPNNTESFPPLDNSNGLWVYGSSGTQKTWCFDLLQAGDFRFRGRVWGDLPSSGDTCAAIKLANPGAPNGVYTVDPDGAGGNPAEQAFCDMRGSGVTYLHLLFGSVNQTLPGGTLIQFTEYQDPVLQQAFTFVYNKDGGGLNVAPDSFTTGNCAFDAGGIPANNYLKFGAAQFVAPSTNGVSDTCLSQYSNPGPIKMFLFNASGIVSTVGPTFFADNPPSFSPCCSDSENPAFFWQRLP